MYNHSEDMNTTYYKPQIRDFQPAYLNTPVVSVLRVNDSINHPIVQYLKYLKLTLFSAQIY